MNNTEILALPDVVSALQSWWDETPGAFTRGVTSAVIADLLDDYGFSWGEPNKYSPACAEWLRLGPGSASCVLDPNGGPFHYAAGIFNVSVGTVASPRIMHMVNWFGSQLLECNPRDAITLVSPEDAARLGVSREFREYMMQAFGGATWDREPITVAGFAPLCYGMCFKLNDVQPVGQIDCWCGEHCVTARVF